MEEGGYIFNKMRWNKAQLERGSIVNKSLWLGEQEAYGKQQGVWGTQHTMISVPSVLMWVTEVCACCLLGAMYLFSSLFVSHGFNHE